MAFRDTQNPGIGGLDELTTAEETAIQNIAALGDPGADRILFWDESANAFAYLTVGSGLTITNTTITGSGDGIPTVLALSAGSATPAINTDTYRIVHITAQSAAITSFTTNLSGTPVDGQTLRISITDDGTARAITWGASFEASTAALPTTTVISTRLDVGFVWNTETTKWRCVATA